MHYWISAATLLSEFQAVYFILAEVKVISCAEAPSGMTWLLALDSAILHAFLTSLCQHRYKGSNKGHSSSYLTIIFLSFYSISDESQLEVLVEHYYDRSIKGFSRQC